MSAKTGQVVTPLFSTTNPLFGSAMDAGSLPTGTLYLNGTANGAAVTVTNLATGLYKAAVTMPTLAVGDRVSIVITATVGGVTGRGVIWGDMGETAAASDVYARLGAPAGASVVADIATLATDFSSTDDAVLAVQSQLGNRSIPAASWSRVGTMLTPSAAWETGRGAHNGWIEEPSVVRAADGTWMLFYSSGYTDHLDSIGIGLATGPTALGPWTRYAPAPAAATIANASFETDGGGGVATGWTLSEDVAGTPTCSIVAGRTGGTYAQRIQYTPQAGDTGKHIWLYKTIAIAGLLRNDFVVYSLWHKGSGGGHTVKSDPVVAGSGAEPAGAEGNFTPGGAWAQFVPDPGLSCSSAATGTSINWRVLCINLTADTGAIDITVDDAAMTYGIREPVKRDVIRSNVKRYGPTYYMVGANGGNIILCSSADGIRWGSNTTILTPGAGLWDAQLTNSSLFQDNDGTWYLYYESGAWTIGVASAPTITGPYTKHTGNPLLGGDEAGRPAVYRQGTTYYMYYHGYADGDVGNVINRATATSPLGPFVADQEPVFQRIGADEGEGLSTAQAADPYIFSDGEQWILYYSATDWAGSSGTYPSHTKAMTAPLTSVFADLAVLAASAASADAKLGTPAVSITADIATRATPGSAMTLTSGERTSVASAVSGLATTGLAALKSLLDAVKLKSDTIGGAGGIAWPYTLTMNGAAPIADAEVWITSDEAGHNVVASGRTNDFGALVPVPKLDAGTYYFWAKKSGVNFDSPDIEVIV